ncbi:MAG: hypothetical protein QY325_04340 [Flavobacteriales bacterium]|nr:MAG: hypothetical protein QY325_04340 [Flavobacteriales bacterium]
MKHAILAIALALLATGCKKEEQEGPSSTPCTYTVSPWSTWSNGYRTREVLASPIGCTGTAPSTIEEHGCVALNRGWLRVVNMSANPYQVTVSGPTGVLPFTLAGGYARDSIYVGVGTYALHALQLSGYVLFPSEFNGARTVARCNKVAWSFP